MKNITELKELIYAKTQLVRDIIGVLLQNRDRYWKPGWENRWENQIRNLGQQAKKKRQKNMLKRKEKREKQLN